MSAPMNDEQVQARIGELEREEQRLRSDEQAAADTARACSPVPAR
jgi:hypothetical protein